MPRRRADKIDANQPGIVSDLEDLGFSVEVGYNDILVGKHNRTWWFEIKAPESVSKRTKKILDSAKKPDQIRLENEFKGQYDIVSCTDDILKVINKEL